MIPLIATYRLQLNAAFTLNDARARIPYLRALGVSHLYLSPILTARSGSTHGYDVADPTQVSEALGGESALASLANAAHEAGMGIVLDIVPNHMGVGPDNPYWVDLLTHGRASRYADWFDVAWRAPTRRLADKVLVPILGDTLDKVIGRDEIRLERFEPGVRVRYFEHHFPLDPSSVPAELEGLGDDAIGAWSEGENGRARLRALLARQHYELAFWRAAQRDVNYRRFFDVNELVSLRVEREDVFTATHREVLRFVADGLVDGLRVDHVDGLLEPRRYLERLRAAVDARSAAHVPIFVEKILASGETLPAEWPVDGTTGYEFMTTLEDVFIDPAGHAAIERRYRGDRAEHDFASVALESKRRVLRGTLNADVRRIAPMLAAVARAAGWPVRPIAEYARAIVELVAALPVYRTYIDAEHPDAGAHDRRVLDAAMQAIRANASLDAGALDALDRALLGTWGDAEPGVARVRMSFVLRWQQLTGPAAAKGVEDTALYVYAPLSSRNEVGGDPGAPVAGAVARLEARLAQRAEGYPLSLNATNTHDTKRSADARARIDALSEHELEWTRAMRRWRRRHRPLRTRSGSRHLPTRAEDDFIHQALVGVWPLTSASLSGDEWLMELRERLTAYLRKAFREAKVSTSWTNPDVAYERAIAEYVARILDRDASAPFLNEVRELVALIAPQAMWTTLSRLVVHLTAPGVPDLYQGDELWFAALVDPDNRRPVDWAARERAVVEGDVAMASAPSRSALLATWRDGLHAGELKMLLTRALLAARRSEEALVSGGYEPLRAEGAHADRVVAFRRRAGESDVIVAVARTTGALGFPPSGDAWRDTRINVPSGDAGSWRCVIHETEHPRREGVLAMRDVFGTLPVAVLVAG